MIRMLKGRLFRNSIFPDVCDEENRLNRCIFSCEESTLKQNAKNNQSVYLSNTQDQSFCYNKSKFRMTFVVKQFFVWVWRHRAKRLQSFDLICHLASGSVEWTVIIIKWKILYWDKNWNLHFADKLDYNDDQGYISISAITNKFKPHFRSKLWHFYYIHLHG